MALNPAFDYASRDFSNIKRDLLRRARLVAPSWTDRDPSDFGMMLVDMWAYMGDILHYYIDRAAKEAFVQTATQRESVLALSNLYDYSPNFRTSAQAVVYVSNRGSASVTVPANTKFRAVHDDRYYYFYTNSVNTINAETTSPLTVFEGTLIEDDILSSSATGLSNQKYQIYASDVVPTTVRVFVTISGERSEWLQYPSIGAMPPGVPGFSINVTPEDKVEILFGDRASGRIPPSGSIVNATYVTSNGSGGNIPENTIITFDNNPSPNLVIQGATAATGGSNGESVESIRSALQSIIKTQDRAVTLQDYRDLSLSIDGVYNSVVSYTPGSASASGGGSVTVYPLPLVTDYLNTTSFSIPVPTAMRTSIFNTLTANSMLGITVQVASSITLIKTNITVSIDVDPRYVNKWVKLDVEEAINNFFKFESVDFGKEVRIGDVYKAVLSVNGVTSANISVMEMRDSSNTLVPSGELSPINLLRKGTITITALGGITTSV